MMMENMAGMMLWMLLWGLIGLALLTLIIVAIIWLIRSMIAGSSGDADPAEVELRRRYAAGDIDEEEYQRRRAALRER